MRQETIRIRYSADHKPSAAELGLSGFDIIEQGRPFVFGGIKPGPGEVYGTITVALIAAGAGVIGAAITGVCAYLSSRGAQKVSIKSANGRAIEFPMGASRAQVEAMIKVAIAMDDPEILFGTPLSMSQAQENDRAENGSDPPADERDIWFP